MPKQLCRCHLKVEHPADGIEVVSHTFPPDVSFRFEEGAAPRPGLGRLRFTYLIAESDMPVERGQDRLLAILRYDETYHLFSSTPTTSGSFDHESGINHWRIDPNDGAIRYFIHLGQHHLPYEIPLGQWGQLKAIVNAWSPQRYLGQYWNHYLAMTEAERIIPSTTQWDLRDLWAQTKLITTALEGLEALTSE